MAPFRFLVPLLGLNAAAGAIAQEPLTLRERFPVGYTYHVSTRVALEGTLTLPSDKDKQTGSPLSMTGESAIEYDERVLDAQDNGEVRKTFRVVRRMDFRRKVGQQDQENTLRAAVRRLVLIRSGTSEVPFSPDGPLIWGEIDLVRTDVFTPALLGLLPAEPVKPGDRWKASAEAVRELTDLEKVEDGQIDCRFEGVVSVAGRRQARVALTGSVRGVNEDGPNRQTFDGFYYFDLETNHVGYVSFKGTSELLDGQGQVNGKVEGRFTMARQAHVRPDDLGEAVLRTLTLEPTTDTTLLLYDNEDMGLRFQYPRRWRVSNARGRQLMMDETAGSGLLLTIEPPASTPTAAAYRTEAQQFVKEQNGKVFREEPARAVRGGEQFALEAEMDGKKLWLEYYILKQPLAGVTIAARLLSDDLIAMRQDVARIARTLTVTKALQERKPMK